MNKKFYPNDGRPPISFASTDEIAEYMGEIMQNLGPIEVDGKNVLTQIYGQYLKLGEVK